MSTALAGVLDWYLFTTLQREVHVHVACRLCVAGRTGQDAVQALLFHSMYYQDYLVLTLGASKMMQ